ncbi:hypothetical protein HPB51_001265 [Rhipicephalus microplus]|uniref:Uncharacterized protein n=1 Tax=Rhipicephalus microplus TaxID=6941 RepID=A0A9J6E5D1_RHIMP|nr:hypothetical protein HPB51_001265 [Rhipicephalus microplus]
MDDPPERSAPVTWGRYFILMIVDVIAAYQLVLLTMDVFFGSTITPSFAHLQLLTSYVASALSGHIFMSSIGKLRPHQHPCHAVDKTTRKGKMEMLSLSRTLLVSSFIAFGILDVCAQSFKPFKYASLMRSRRPSPAVSSVDASSNTNFNTNYNFSAIASRMFFTMLARRSMYSGGKFSLTSRQLVDLACFYTTTLLKLAVMLNYVRLVEDAQTAIRSLAPTSRRLGIVTAQEVRELGAVLVDVLKMVHSLEAAFSLLVLVWYAELMLAIVASVNIGLSFVQNSRSFWVNGVRLPRNVYLLSVYALLSHRLCSVHGEARKMAATLGHGLSSRVDPRRGAVCGAVKILRRCASLGEAFTLTALDSFDLDDRFYVNTLGSVIMYGVILQQLTTAAG